MTNTTKLFDLTELAEASYAQFNLFGNVQQVAWMERKRNPGFDDSESGAD